MCGIIGYIGDYNAVVPLFEGIERLHYRGYDSSGIGTLSESGELLMCKQPDKNLSEFREQLISRSSWGTIGIGHTRWATHGAPSVENAHPQLSPNGTVAVVHNGTIDNFDELKEALRREDAAITFQSETDTEIIAILIEQALRSTNSLGKAVRIALTNVVGPFAIAVISTQHPDMIVAACNGSPLLVGKTINEREWFVASDASAFAHRARLCLPLEDGELAVLRRGSPFTIERLQDGATIEEAASRLHSLSHTPEHYTKGGHPHFMHLEIHASAESLRNTLRGRSTGMQVRLGALDDIDSANRLRDAERIVILGCGTSLFAGMVGKELIERFAQIPVEVADSSHWHYGAALINSRCSVIALSQSGETKDTLEAVRLARARGALTFSITNRVGSTLSRQTARGIYLRAGPEVAVASTKTFICQVAALALLATKLAVLRRSSPAECIHKFLQALLALPEQLEDVLSLEGEIKTLVGLYHEARCIPIIGRGFCAPLALEGALKLQEIAYEAGAHGFVASALKHGPLALIEEGIPVIAIVPRDTQREKMIGNISEALARGAHIIAFTTGNDEGILRLGPSDRISTVSLPETVEELYPILAAPLLQLFAYHLGVLRSIDVDQPRNLAKSVTV